MATASASDTGSVMSAIVAGVAGIVSAMAGLVAGIEVLERVLV